MGRRLATGSREASAELRLGSRVVFCSWRRVGGRYLGGPGKRVSRGLEVSRQVDSDLEQAVQTLAMSRWEALHVPHQSDPVKGGPGNTC